MSEVACSVREAEVSVSASASALGSSTVSLVMSRKAVQLRSAKADWTSDAQE